MIRAIVGENATGKSLYLKNKCLGNPSVVTNLEGFDCSYSTFNKDRLRVLELYTAGDIVVEEDSVYVQKGLYKISKEIYRYISLLCRDGDNLILDEPDLLIDKEDDIVLLYNLLVEIGRTYEEVYVVTHCTHVLHHPLVEVCEVSAAGELIRVPRVNYHGKLL